MGTKLRSIKYSAGFKVLAVIIGVIGIIELFFGLMKYPDYYYGIQKSNYIQSAALKEEMTTIQSLISQVTEYQSEDNIKSGKLVSEAELNNRIEATKSELNYSIQNITNEYGYQIASVLEHNAKEAKRLENERDKEIDKLIAATDKQLSSLKNTIISEELSDFKEKKNLLGAYKGLDYTVISQGVITGQKPEFYKTLTYFYKSLDAYGKAIYIGFDNVTFSNKRIAYAKQHENGTDGILKLISGLILIVLSFIWLILTAGRSRKSEEIKLYLVDKMYLDIFLGLVLIITISSIALTGQLLYSFSELKENYDVNFFNIACISLLCIAYMTIAVYLVTLSKRVKLGRVIKTTLLYKLSSLIFRIFKRWGMGIKNGFNSGPLLIKAILFLVIYTIILFIDVEVLAHKSIMSFIVFIILTTGAFYLLAKRVTSFRVMTEGIKKVKNGELSYKIPLCGSYTIDSIAEDINNIAEGLRGAVENEMKAEHMKVELITNVSHDLKTPLTSIITYIDLLSKENTAQEDTKEYIEILRAKSAKLNNLVEDLFEVSKAQSGTTPLKLEKLCLNDLITQSYAEYQDAFETARLEIKFNIPQTKIMVLADGAKMWRVLSNVFNNTLKYSLEGTRVYLDVEVLQDKAIITFKNISNYAMNFKANEIAERFKRGDESRSSEGSGLGLAIVKSFMDMQKGSSEITVDGDLFKIKLILKNEI